MSGGCLTTFVWHCKAKVLVAGLSVRMLWIDNFEVYLGLWYTKWHCDTSILLFTAFPCHCLSNNS